MTSLFTYWNTLKYLKPVQIYGRVRFRLHRSSPDTKPAPKMRARSEGWQWPARRRASLVGRTTFRFLNEEQDLDVIGWDGAEAARLWSYNLHYFDDLNAETHEARAAWHVSLIRRWIADNPPARGVGWEPYPTSLRIVNWIKWVLGGAELPEVARDSLAVQARWLSARIEWHLLGNHLYANAKALAYAGAFFAGEEAEGWLAKAVSILADETLEQFLPDGGQFERSPMYHALALEDLLDLINLDRVFPRALPPQLVATLRATAERARRWLAVMTHPDGEISFFNDAAVGIVPPPAELEAYALRLSFAPRAAVGEGVIHLPESGYVRLQRGTMTALLDVGPIGPDYLPGHAHADTLSFELSLAGARMLVNSGTSVYELGPERLYQRGTAAHNTVAVGGADSSEVWGGFRVARRARPFDLKIEETHEEIIVGCSHDGYRRLPGAPVHRRIWRAGELSIRVTDAVVGSDRLDCVSYWRGGADVAISDAIPFCFARRGGPTLSFSTHGGAWSRADTTLHPEFGLSVPGSMLVCAFPAGVTSEARIAWDHHG